MRRRRRLLLRKRNGIYFTPRNYSLALSVSLGSGTVLVGSQGPTWTGRNSPSMSRSSLILLCCLLERNNCCRRRIIFAAGMGSSVFYWSNWRMYQAKRSKPWWASQLAKRKQRSRTLATHVNKCYKWHWEKKTWHLFFSLLSEGSKKRDVIRNLWTPSSCFPWVNHIFDEMTWGDDTVMTQLYLCEEPYWSKYEEACPQELEINVISDGRQLHCAYTFKSNGLYTVRLWNGRQNANHFCWFSSIEFRTT